MTKLGNYKWPVYCKIIFVQIWCCKLYLVVHMGETGCKPSRHFEHQWNIKINMTTQTCRNVVFRTNCLSACVYLCLCACACACVSYVRHSVVRFHMREVLRCKLISTHMPGHLMLLLLQLTMNDINLIFNCPLFNVIFLSLGTKLNQMSSSGSSWGMVCWVLVQL